MVAREMQTYRNNETLFPNTNGGDISKEFEEARRPHIMKALKSILANLKEEKTAHGKRKVRANQTAPRNMTEAMRRPDSKE